MVAFFTSLVSGAIPTPIEPWRLSQVSPWVYLCVYANLVPEHRNAYTEFIGTGFRLLFLSYGISFIEL